MKINADTMNIEPVAAAEVARTGALVAGLPLDGGDAVTGADGVPVPGWIRNVLIKPLSS